MALMPDNIREPNVASISLRKFPYPYRAGFALSSDIDLCDRKRFVELHRFLNSEADGLGLPVADSFFGCAMGLPQLGYLMPDGETESPDAPFIREAIRSGLIDTLHTWGDFNDTPVTVDRLKRIATGLVARFECEGLKVPLWVNHGSPENVQNLAPRQHPSYQGDDPRSPFRMTNLMRQMGISYFCPTEVVSWPLSVGTYQNPFQAPARYGFNVLKNVAKVALGRAKLVLPSNNLFSICLPDSLQDGTRLWRVTRYRPPAKVVLRPSRHSFRFSLSEEFIQEHVRSEGYVVLYTHLGLPLVQDSEGLFPTPDRKALESLAEKFYEGLIWVAPVAQLVKYFTTHKYLVWEPKRVGEKTVVHIQGVDDPIAGMRDADQASCCGITFYVDHPENVSIVVAGRPLKTKLYPPDHTGRPSVGVPIPPPPSLDILKD
ncbi:MAG: hypothetical protein GF344_12770 [Chitinivibrionales bacterium]|nr:hypothetical protein [Chitinivibrionales bacterium]MBD3357616.1 hypothetical protein [Chitinivibrionales bacterium]